MIQTNSRLKLTIIGVFLIFQIVCKGQNALVPDIRPSAAAAALGKCGSFLVSYATGQAKVPIPVTPILSNGMDMSFELNYDGMSTAHTKRFNHFFLKFKL